MWFVVAIAGGAGCAYASGCPNEVVRTESNSTLLPECRAYEMVSPVAKDGWQVRVAGADGSRALLTTIGSFAGSTQKSVLNFYRAERTLDGWMTMPFAVPLGLINTSIYNILAADSDLDSGLFEYRSASGTNVDERDFYVQRLPDGSPIEVGPAFPRKALESSSPGEVRELSARASMLGEHVLFTIGGPSKLTPGVDDLWPGDTTVEASSLGFGSLYEYAGSGSEEPKLVGVSNRGGLNDNSEAQLISQCGTSLGFPAEGKFTVSFFPVGEAYNAIAESGGSSRVFFTAASADEGPSGDACNASGEGRGPSVDELYVRIDASETVALSEPALSVPGRACSGACLDDEENPSKRSAGIFQGASEDGAKVFFLTNQPLVNSDEDDATDLYEAEIGGDQGDRRVVRLVQVSHDPNLGEAAEVQGVARVSEDGSHVYFVARGMLTTKANSAGDVAQTGADNFYVYDTDAGQIAFIGRLCSGAESSGLTLDPECPAELNAEPPGKDGLNDLGDWQQEDSRSVDATPDGKFVIFSSYADMTPGDTSTVSQVFEYDAETEALSRVSIGEDGYDQDGNTAVPADGAKIIAPSYVVSQDPAPQLTSLSDDGSVVVFQSNDALTSHAVEGYPNVYEYRNGQVYLISDGVDRTLGFEDVPTTSLVGVDGSGQDIFFTTADQLVPLDGDTQEDVYDARVEGGFPPPVVRSECEGDGCQGPAASSPSLVTAGSAAQAAENVGASSMPAVRAKTVKAKKITRCAKGKKLNNGRCVKVKLSRKKAAASKGRSLRAVHR